MKDETRREATRELDRSNFTTTRSDAENWTGPKWLRKLGGPGTLFVAAIVLTIAAVVVLLFSLRPTSRTIAWPAGIGSAIAVSDDLQQSTDDSPRPLASVTKLVTALVVLDAAPLTGEDSGPFFTMTDSDVDLVAQSAAVDGQTVPVVAGQSISERELFEVMLVASSNNHAESLAAHVFGSRDAFLAAARTWLDDHGLTAITIADASGLSSSDIGSPLAVARLGLLAAASEVVAKTTAMTSVTTADGSILRATDDLLGTFGIRGLKTGSTAAAGFNAVMLADTQDGRPFVVVVLGASTLAERNADVTQLLAEARTRWSSG